ncbi:uncharacterized protein LOC116210090 [Punica granatum]|uniref:DUF4228 domain-containing protein n=2 Tax=Punica granatum TaxID=22663 RepID=A0A218WT32_PUNGR|nr:uncharacterized protein LOC116210090 [Punica granatum]OWM76027.1 hypothetical protein CDL15_Pgr009672 [Punica granatum]PKI56223.1 hypothetical protein CRG98_023418 [Punica granatum]
MGNCQAVDAAVLVIQHPSGRIERLYWSVAASEVMRTNPGHYVSLIIPLPPSSDQDNAEKGEQDKKPVRFTRVKLLRPNETLNLGHAYRLVTSQEVMKVLKAKKYAKMKEKRPESGEKQTVERNRTIDNEGDRQKAENSNTGKEKKTNLEKTSQDLNHGRQRPRMAPWRPTLQSIAEGGR